MIAAASCSGGWDPTRYARFERERSQPFHDLLALVERRPAVRRMLDLGCGTGELTRLAARTLGAVETVAVDSSEDMLARAGADASVRFVHRDIADFVSRAVESTPTDGAATDDAYDVVISNAALHWVPDHPRLFAAIAERIAAFGQLAVQMPNNDEHPSHVAALDVAREPAFAADLGGYAGRARILGATAYARLLAKLGFARQRVLEETYLHRLASREAVVEWIEGTLLSPFRARLSSENYGCFRERYRERLFELVPDERPFLYSYPRLFLWASR